MVWLTRAEASSTLRLKSFMVLLVMTRREWIHAALRIARQGYYFVPKVPGQW
jgi:hypothetical protein